MASATVSVWRSEDGHETFVEERTVDLSSAKPLNGARARRILLREFPELAPLHFMFKTERGWRVSRTVRPIEHCSYPYVWNYYYVMSN